MKNAVLLTAMLLFSHLLFSQSTDEKDVQKFNFGFNIGVNYSNLQSKELLLSNTSITNGFGYSIGLFMDYAISDKFIISPKTEIAFYNSSVEVADKWVSSYIYDVFPVCVNINNSYQI